MSISREALESAAKALFARHYDLSNWDDADAFIQRVFLVDAANALVTAAPHMLAEAWEEGYGLGYSDAIWSKGHEPRARNPFRSEA